MISNLLKFLSHQEDTHHTSIDQQHVLDQLKVSNNGLLVSNLVVIFMAMTRRRI
jgi:hypothetical protein